MIREAQRSLYDAVAFGAHPDDVEMAMAGTMAALAGSGRKTAMVNLTGGEMGSFGTPEERAREAEVAAGILGCDLRILDFPDGGVESNQEGRLRVAALLRELRPRIVFAPYPHSRSSHLDGRSNVDHLATGILVRDACKLARLGKILPDQAPHEVQRVFYYMLPDDLRPSYLVDVSAHAHTIEQSIRAYESQMSIEKSGRNILDLLMILRKGCGQRLGVDLAEGFVCEDALGGPVDLLFEV